MFLHGKLFCSSSPPPFPVTSCETNESLFVYVNQSFSPAPDTEIRVLYDCFGSDGKLVLYYCKTQAWG